MTSLVPFLLCKCMRVCFQNTYGFSDLCFAALNQCTAALMGLTHSIHLYVLPCTVTVTFPLNGIKIEENDIMFYEGRTSWKHIYFQVLSSLYIFLLFYKLQFFSPKRNKTFFFAARAHLFQICGLLFCVVFFKLWLSFRVTLVIMSACLCIMYIVIVIQSAWRGMKARRRARRRRQAADLIRRCSTLLMFFFAVFFFFHV